MQKLHKDSSLVMNLKKLTNPQFIISSLFNLLILVLPLYFRFDTEELFEFNKMILVYGFTILIATAWIYRMIVEKRLIFKRTVFDFALLLFFGSQLISTIFSIHPYTSIFGYYSRFHGGLLSTLSYVTLFYAFVSNLDKKHLGSFFNSAFLSALIVSIYGILEHFGHSISCLLLPGQTSFGVDCWIQDVQNRVFATFGQPNWLAAYAITLFPVAAIAAIQKKLSGTKRGYFIATAISLVLVLLYTRSRSGFFGFAVSALTFLLTYAIFIKKPIETLKKKVSLRTLLLIAGISIFLILSVGTPFSESFYSRFTTQNIDSQTQEQPATTSDTPEVVQNRLEIGGTDSGDIRKVVWTGAYKIWQRYPLIGSGVETFAYSYYQDRIREHNDVSEWDFLYNKAHNEILNILATTGTIGLLTYAFLYGVFVLTALKIVRKSSSKHQEKLLAVAIISASAGLFVSNFFGFSTVAVAALQYLFFGVIVLLHDPNSEASDNKRHSLSDGSQYFAVTVLALGSLILLMRTYNYFAADRAFADGKSYFDSGQFQFGIQKQLEAIEKSPREALFYDNISDDYAKLAAHFATSGEATAAAQFAQQSVIASDTALQLNPRHLNFYKTRARVFVTLSQLDEAYIAEAAATVEQAITLSPTDPKLYFTLAVIEDTTGNIEYAEELYLKAIELKPNYERPYWKLSEMYEAQGDIEKAVAYTQYILDRIDPNNAQALERIQALQSEAAE